jgi:hypothetical protein
MLYSVCGDEIYDTAKQISFTDAYIPTPLSSPVRGSGKFYE